MRGTVERSGVGRQITAQERLDSQAIEDIPIDGFEEPVAFAANQRDEVRLIADDGSRAATVMASQQRGTTMVAQPDDIESDTVAFKLDSVASNSMKSSNPDSGIQSDVQLSPTLDTMQPNPALNQGGLAITQSDDVAAITSKGNGDCYEAKSHPTLTSSQGGQAGQGYPAVRQPDKSREMIVRRLTPLECERLQGFPDNWTRIAWKGKPESECPDGHRYKACGNSMAVPVIRWLGERIEAVDTIPITELPESTGRILTDFTDGVAVSQDTMDEWFS